MEPCLNPIRGVLGIEIYSEEDNELLILESSWISPKFLAFSAEILL